MSSTTVVADAAARAAEQAAEILAKMTLREKIAQMTQAEKGSITPEDVARHGIGSVLSGGGGNPEPNDPANWREMVMSFRRAALKSRLGVPLIYGSDAVHGHNNVVGATIFPHNVGLGAVGDEDLVRRIGRATALEAAATGVRWSFAPAVSIPLDIRWGRSYEGYAQDPELVSRLAVALVEGFEGAGWDHPHASLPSVKHYLADGAARFGSSTRIDRAGIADLHADRTLSNANVDTGFLDVLLRGAWTVDQGDATVSEQVMREVFLPPYRAAIAAGALNVMVSYSSWHGERLHAHRYLLTDLLKGELGFEGFIVSDWAGVDQVDPDFSRCVELAVNAGIDMVMVPFDYLRFMEALEAAVESGAVSGARIDDAARRILYVKARLGLFDGADDEAHIPDLRTVGHADHRRLAHEAARRSLVLLKNDGDVLPLRASLPKLIVAGAGADDVGLQCGGWTISWMGGAGPITQGTTLLQGLRALSSDTEILHDPQGSGVDRAPVGIVVVAETPYAEGMGDRFDLRLSAEDRQTVAQVRARVERLVLIVYSGRPVVLAEAAAQADAIVAAWLPGSEGAAVAEPILGISGFEGTLRYRWPTAVTDLPLHPFKDVNDGGGARPALFEIGHGIHTRPWHEQGGSR
ncbi:MAG: glycoside hydrolase family 3 C-terminal domain-containing protein [Trueperaceae bacterium]|nr:glycoside hydrolase family 3 C-terminal domain-containing protein [Trueperaceae bacterium]